MRLNQLTFTLNEDLKSPTLQDILEEKRPLDGEKALPIFELQQMTSERDTSSEKHGAAFKPLKQEQ